MANSIQQQISSTAVPSLADALAAIPVFDGIDRENIEWFAHHSEDLRLTDGALVARAGDPADWLVVILEGEVHARRDDNPQAPTIYIGRAGQVSGMLPYSRMTVMPAAIYVVGNTRLARFPKSLFPEMMQRIPELTPRLVGVLADRIRDATKNELEREKMSALGKLSAGLAHELNNPAAALRQAVQSLREAFARLNGANAELRRQHLSDPQFEALSAFETTLSAGLAALAPVDDLQRSDREAELEAWLSKHQVDRPWELAPNLAEAGATEAIIGGAALGTTGPALAWSLRHAAAHVEVARILDDADRASTRISELLKAVKEYTYMDQGGEQEIDLRAGLENTLAMFHYRLKHGVTLRRQYDCTLPKIRACGGELNQVWTNLIDNALDAIEEKGELTVRTVREPVHALVEIIDNGPGIPAAAQSRIFEPFFTTKEIGKGTGLGLEMAYRIIRKHRGDIRFQSQPGRTAFQVRLPIPESPAKPEKS